MTRFFTIIFLVALVGCSSHNIQKYGNIDSRNKTITVPAGSKSVKGDIKKILHDNGWRLFVYGGPEVTEVTEATIGGKKVETYNTFNTRYSLHVSSRWHDTCLNLRSYISYEISIIDNKNGSEVIALDGIACQNKIAKVFSKTLQENSQ